MLYRRPTEEARTARRAAKLAAMPPLRAWRRMTREERLLKTADAEFALYGEVVSPDAKSAHDARAAREAPAIGERQTSRPGRSSPLPRPAATGRSRHESARQADDSPTASPIGANYRHIDMEVAILAASRCPTVPLKTYGLREQEHLEPGAGTAFVVVRTEVFNGAAKSICLTCARPIETHVLDDRGRRFDSVGRLNLLAGNPECSDKLQPGFTSQMIWAYRVPLDLEIVAFEFEDISDFSRDRAVKPTCIPLVIPEP